MGYFKWSVAFTLLAVALAFAQGLLAGFHGTPGLVSAMTASAIALMLGVMEVSLSFDNAIINAATLEHLDARWRRRFLTWGIWVAVFGMRLVFPVLIVAVAAKLPVGAVVDLALHDGARYGAYLHDAHPMIAAFGGTFLLLVFLGFAFDTERDTHWLPALESRLAFVGKLPSAAPLVALVALLGLQAALPDALRQPVLFAGVAGVVLYTLVDGLGDMLGAEEAGVAVRSGVMGFLYLELLDASFSFDGVIGAFAVTREVWLIALGLGIGAMFVRALTLYLTEAGTLREFVYLEHGAQFAIGTLAALLLASTVPGVSVPEIVTGMIGVAFVGAATWASWRERTAGALDAPGVAA